MRRTHLVGAAASLILALGMTACAGSEKERSAADIKKDLSADLERNGDGLDGAAADCLADAIIEEVGVEALREVDLTADEPEGDIADDIAAAASRAEDECRPSS